MTLPTICAACKECTGNGQLYWCARESGGDIDKWLSNAEAEMPQLAIVAQLAAPPEWCPLRKAITP